ncbi:MAG: Re/Si-specific NAD(P)(+) transhydrogenase subunit alpha [Candidatus Hydrogenedens sp.]|nr:Re/Si-specific NAD(P)(+) transhydrogenase subunit alpha [Candidatus Hydrogenedens sp.]
MQLFVPRETDPRESRTALTPDGAAQLIRLGAQITVESGLGEKSGFSDALYERAGAKITADRNAALADASLVLQIRKPAPEEITLMKEGALLISLLEPFTSFELLDTLEKQKINAVALEMIPRTTLAQKMDVLSSQANLAGYEAVLVAASHLAQVLPMMMTPAGTLKPARVFIIGVGVAGLQAIATAKRLGARVEAFDTRPSCAEQVQSLGARFVKIDLGETGQTEDGYAQELSEEQQALQKEAMAKVIAQSDIVITTAQVFGRQAPCIVSRAMVEAMKPGSVVVDLAAETGGNVEGVEPGEVKLINGVKLIGAENYAGRVPAHASQMFSANAVNFISHFWDEEQKDIQLNLEDEILDGCMIIQDGVLRNEMIRKARQA